MPPIDIEKFFSDPKHESEKNFLTQAVEKILEDRERKKSEDTKKKTKEEKGFFDKLWSGD